LLQRQKQTDALLALLPQQLMLLLLLLLGTGTCR